MALLPELLLFQRPGDSEFRPPHTGSQVVVGQKFCSHGKIFARAKYATTCGVIREKNTDFLQKLEVMSGGLHSPCSALAEELPDREHSFPLGPQFLKSSRSGMLLLICFRTGLSYSRAVTCGRE